MRTSACSACEMTYFAVNASSCVACSSIVTNCYNCAQLGGYVMNCTQCVDGYFPDTTTNCKLCSDQIGNCSTCTPDFLGGATCVACMTKFYTASGTSCIACSTIDVNCYSCNNNAQCTLCEIGYYVNSNHACTQAPPCTVSNCATCTLASSTQCANCNTYFTLSSDNASCIPPASCPYAG